MKLISISLLVVCAFLNQACQPKSDAPGTASKAANQSAKPGEVTDVTVEQAEELIKAGKVKVLDVRTPAEFEMEHIEGAINVDAKSATFKDELAKLDKSTPYLLHCRSGARSSASLPALQEAGFQKIHHLTAGLMAWKEAKKPLVPLAAQP